MAQLDFSPKRPLKLALVTIDNRENSRQYHKPDPFFGTAVQALLDGFAQLPDIEVDVICNVQQPVRAPERLAPNIRYHSLIVPKIGWLRTAYSGCVLAVRRKLRELQPDIVHGQGTERDCSTCAVLSGYPNLLTIHGNMRSIARVNRAKPFSLLWCAARMERFVLPRTRGVLCISSYTRNLVKDLAPQTWLVPNAVDSTFFDLKPASDSSTPIGLCVGTICHHKNQNALIRALDPLAATQKFKIIFAGDLGNDPFANEFRQLLAQRAWCEYIGFLTREQLKARLTSASFLVLPTLEDNCPMVVLEAMAAGVPVLASGIGGIPDLIEHEKTGLICDPRIIDGFRESLARVLSNPVFASDLAKSARTQAFSRFHPKIIARKHLDIYKTVLRNA